MILSAHQPYFLPWCAFFDKVARSDIFVVLDHVQYGSESFQNRNRVKIASGAHWITVPLQRRGLGERICDKAIQNEGDWQRRIRLTLEQSYRKARFFADYFETLDEIFSRRWERLLDLNLALLRQMFEWLAIRTPMVRSSTLGIDAHKTDLVAALCDYFGAGVYRSGVGGSRGYLDEAALAARGVKVVWNDYRHPVYRQQHMGCGFVPDLSAIDLLFNCGPEARALLLGEESAPCTPALSADGQ